MCLAVFAHDAHPDWPLVVVANRDEFHSRPTTTMHPWPGPHGMLAGKDESAGGTWFGVTNNGKFALLTNVRQPQKRQQAQTPSRGELVARFLSGKQASRHFLTDLKTENADQYRGFNLVIGHASEEIWHASNRPTPVSTLLGPGVHGISNASLNTPWPKTVRTTAALKQWLANTEHDVAPDIDALAAIMADTTTFDDAALPNTGVGLIRERLLAPSFIVSDDYGTRSTTVLLVHRTGWQWVQEDTHNPSGDRINRVRYCCSPNQPWRAADLDAGSLNTDSPAMT